MKIKCGSCGTTKWERTLSVAERIFFTDEELSRDEQIDDQPCSECYQRKITRR